MLYFAYWVILIIFKWKDDVRLNFYKKFKLKGYKLNFRSKYRAADIEKKNSIVPGGLFEISKSDEKKLDIYEDYQYFIKKCILNIITKK